MDQAPLNAPRSGLDAVIEAYKKDIDRTLLRENLRLSVEQRLVNLSRLHDFAAALRGTGRRTRGRP
jgi:hypothetical protein